jgi:hypothetical protein
MRHFCYMRTIALLLVLLPACAVAQPKLTPKDESEIRKAIKELAMNENQKGTGEVWSERGPVIYRVRTIELLAADVATAETEGVRTPFGERHQFVFIMLRSGGHWTLGKRLTVCQAVGMQLITGTP